MKVLIVDDEVIIRNGLSTVINWEELGFTLLPPAASGEEALSRLMSEQPNIVLADIQMTGMNGIQLIAEAKKQLPDIEFIILTGFDTFTFAQQAIREGVSDYLLKSSRPEEIIMAAMKAKQRLLVRWESIHQEHLGRTALRDQLLDQLLTEGTIHTPIKYSIPKMLPCLRFDGTPMRILLVAASGWTEQPFDVSLAHFAVNNIVQELVVCETRLHHDYILIIMHKDGDKYGMSEHQIEKELARIRHKLKCKLFVAAGSYVQSLEDLRKSYEEALYTFTFRWISPEDAFITYDHVKGRGGGTMVISETEEAQLVHAIKSSSTIRLRHWVDDVIEARLAEPWITPDSLQAYLHSIMLTSQRWLARVMDTLGEAMTLPTDYSQEVHTRTGSPSEIVFRSLSAMMNVYAEVTSGERVSYIKRAKAYIHDHLDKNITLQQVAKSVHLNPNHFSEVFKRETGMTYIEFVTSERLSKAMELLDRSVMKVSEIAGRVGYEDVKYFGQIFKRDVGMTPSEYRNRPTR